MVAIHLAETYGDRAFSVGKSTNNLVIEST
jgi:hypothetical protein